MGGRGDRSEERDPSVGASDGSDCTEFEFASRRGTLWRDTSRWLHIPGPSTRDGGRLEGLSRILTYPSVKADDFRGVATPQVVQEAVLHSATTITPDPPRNRHTLDLHLLQISPHHISSSPAARVIFHTLPRKLAATSLDRSKHIKSSILQHSPLTPPTHSPQQCNMCGPC
jgi:hypothetical protein